MSSLAAIAARRALARHTPVARTTSQLSRPAVRRYASKVEEAKLDKGAKRDPELYTLMGIMVAGFGLAGWYLGSSPTSATSESNVRIGESTMPWHMSDEEAAEGKEMSKYQYHPHGDKSKPLRNAPSALNEVVIPNVTLPEDLHERFNKYGKDL